MESRLGAIFFVNQVVSMFFVVDMGINFNLAYVDRNSFELIQDERRIRWHYVSSMWFWLDLVSVIPFDVITMSIEGKFDDDDGDGDGDGGHGIAWLGIGRSLRLVRLLRLMKLIRLTKLNQVLKKYENQMTM